GPGRERMGDRPPSGRSTPPRRRSTSGGSTPRRPASGTRICGHRAGSRGGSSAGATWHVYRNPSVIRLVAKRAGSGSAAHRFEMVEHQLVEAVTGGVEQGVVGPRDPLEPPAQAGGQEPSRDGPDRKSVVEGRRV